jgi:hypothetical protein
MSHTHPYSSSTTDHLASGEVDKWTRINVFRRFLLSAFISEYKVVFISEYLTAFFYAISSITQSVLERTMRSFSFVFLGYAGLMSCRISSFLHFLTLSIWSVDHWLPRGIKIMLYWFRRRFYWRAMPDSHWLSKFFGMYWFLRWFCVETTKICCDKLEFKKTPFCSLLERW